MTLNINQIVKVKLTSFGIAQLEKQHLANKLTEPFQAPTKDEDGYSTFQFWALMHKFGPIMGLNKLETPFDADIKIVTGE